MTELLTAAQMRAVERAAIESGAVTGLELMERAGQGAVDAIFAHWPALAPSRGPAPAPPGYLKREEGKDPRAVVLCGPGNNGGDGFVVARLLREAGWAVEVFLYGDAETLPPDARVNYERWEAMGVVVPLSDRAFRRADDLHGEGYADVYVDALFGTGLTRPLEGAARDVITLMTGRNGDDYSPHTVCIDAPSGLCLDSGRLIGMLGATIGNGRDRFAALTVTFHRAKIGHYVGQGPGLCGTISCIDIGLGTVRAVQMMQTGHWVQRVGPVVSDREPAGLNWPWEWLDKGRDGGLHKYDFGHALILSGAVGRGGAARLAARGALRIGAGAVTVGCPPATLIENAAQLNAVMLRKVKDADALARALEDERINALCLGPGMGTGAREAALVGVALRAGRKVVLDADALTLLSRDADLFGQLHGDCVLTPHAGEFARLFPDIAAKLDAPATTGPAYSKVDATREAAKRAGCVVLFKGPDTVIADSSGLCSVNAAVYDRAAPWLATAGAGDVLAGFITGLLARGFAPMQAAEAGAWLHVECARSFGPGLIAEDLPDMLPGVLKALGA